MLFYDKESKRGGSDLSISVWIFPLKMAKPVLDIRCVFSSSFTNILLSNIQGQHFYGFILFFKGNKRKNFYTGKELQYIRVVHSLSLLGRLLIYKQGRKLFPVQLKNRKGEIRFHNIAYCLIRAVMQSCFS